jgi:hypothetical protein
MDTSHKERDYQSEGPFLNYEEKANNNSRRNVHSKMKLNTSMKSSNSFTSLKTLDSNDFRQMTSPHQEKD